MRILLVDDDELLTQQLGDFLGSQHYAVDVALDGEAGWDYAQAANYDLIVLDINLPKIDGIRLCQKLRQSQYVNPILLLTSQGDSSAKVVGLDAGADDYLVKPCTLSELAARIRALLRRPGTLNNPVLRSGELCIDPSTCEVTYQGHLLSLSSKEYSLLELFLRHPQRIFSSTSILEHLWNFDATPGEETVRTHIKRLRRKLKSVGADTVIDTVYGMGYRLQPPPAASPDPQKAALRDETRAAAIALWDKFKPPTLQRLISLEQAVATLRSGPLPEALRQSALADAHKLSGSLGMFGFAEGSRLAQAIEQVLKTAAPAAVDQLAALVATLQQELQHPPQLPTELLLGPWPATAPAPPAAPSLPPTATSPTPLKVLAVDDDVAILATLQTMLSRWGIEPLTLSDPLQVWSVLEQEVPDLLILDVDMPNLNGLDLCKLIRNHDTWNGLPILFLTAQRQPEVVLQLYNSGADDYVAKPFTEPEVITRIFNRIERHRLLQTWRKPTPSPG
ncbi:response regulator [Leptolyngbya sp. CCNP1308]|uniref:response regulator n=1 Tax=Leptolyngbya sp. CCNP1308 TaxID=3110255 RepID=UPI002B216E26|nr:response regulator [Leptolyngbya sp. CCNP1308]MEA5448235.1 response regulator [Leptolyngbya sp. CCNP1308]